MWSPVLGIHLILRRTRILDSHWIRIQIQVISSKFTDFFLTKQKFQIFCLIFMQNFKNSEIREILYPFFFEFKFELLV